MDYLSALAPPLPGEDEAEPDFELPGAALAPDVDAGPSSPPSEVLPLPGAAVGEGFLESGPGVALVWAGVGLALGGVLLGPWGSAAGLALSGAARNAYRASRYWASPDEAKRAEAQKSTTMALFGLGVAGLLGVQALASGRSREKEP